MNTIRRIISIIAVLLILGSTAGQRTYAAEADKENTEADTAESAAGENTEEDTAKSVSEENAEAKAENTAAETIRQEAGSLIVEAESADYFKYDSGRLYVYGGTVSVKTRSDAEYSTERIEVSGYSVVILSGVRIKAQDGAAIRVLPGTDAEIRLGGEAQGKNAADSTEQTQEENKEDNLQAVENYVEGAPGFAAIEAGTLPRGDGSQALLSSLRVTGGGKLTAVGGEGAAAIGGSRGQSACGIIGIQNGNVKAIGGKGADGIGCAEGSTQDPVYAPTVSGQVLSLTVLSDGKGRPIAPAAVSSEEDGDEEESSDAGDENVSEADSEESGENGNEAGSDEADNKDSSTAASAPAANASLLCATFAEPGDGSLSGLSDVRVRDINSDFEVSFDMPEGYRSFAVKAEPDADLMIEQGGRSFADAGEESFSGEVEVDDEKELLFRAGTDYNAGRIFLSPVVKVPAIDVEVTGQWEDEDNKDGTRPGNVMVTLYANGCETGRTITLSEENDWTGTFEELPVYQDGIRQSYQVVEGRLKGYTGLISGSDREGYTITNEHTPLPEGRSSEEEIALRSQPVQEGVIVAQVLTTKVSRSTPVRTSTTIKKTQSVKTADSSASTRVWGAMLIMAAAALYIWMKYEQRRED